MRAVLIFAWLALMLATEHARAEEETRTYLFFRNATEAIGGGGKWLWDRGADVVDGVGDATDPAPAPKSGGGNAIAQEAEIVRSERLEELASVLRSADAPNYCYDKFLDQMADECLKAMDLYLVEVQTELELLRNEIHAELQMGGG